MKKAQAQVKAIGKSKKDIKESEREFTFMENLSLLLSVLEVSKVMKTAVW